MAYENGIPYHPISSFYKEKFGEKVYKISVSVADTCPNREGLRGMKTCVFCDQYGSAAYPKLQALPLKEQILQTRKIVRERFNGHKFLVYFQAYTTTFNKVLHLRTQFQESLEFSDVVGWTVGTRPDCLSDALFDLWNEYKEKGFLSVELGVQSFSNAQLKWMERGHTREKSIQAIHRIKEKTGVNLGIHLIFGFPGETKADVIEAARLASSLPIDNVKLHNLHVLKHTPLAEMYARGEFKPIELEEYSDWVMTFLQHLDPKIAVHRMAATASRHEELIAPQWTGGKMRVYQHILDTLNANQAYQGQFWQPQ